jgi:hypothetical protein
MNDFYSNNPRPNSPPFGRYPGNFPMPYSPDRPIAPGQEPHRPNFWLRLTSAVAYLPQKTVEQREQVRRNRLASWIILGMFVLVILLSPAGIGSPSTAAAIVIAFVGLIVCSIFNHAGWTTAAGIFLVVLIDAAIFGALAGGSGGLEVVDLPAFDLLAISVVVAATILPRMAAFIVAICNCILIVTSFLLLPEGPDLMHQVAALGTIALLARPIALQILLAIVAYLWVRGVDEQVRRADRAEEMAALEHAYAVQRQQLEIGVQQILQTHVRIANGDYNARAPLTQDNVLWQIAVSLNNLVTRLRTSSQEAGQAAYELARQNDEIQRLAMALRDLQANRRPVWPAPTGTAVDQLILILSGRSRQQQYTLGPSPFSRDGSPPQTGSGPLGSPPTLTPAPAPGQNSFSQSSSGWASYAQPGWPQAPTWPPPAPDNGFNDAPAYNSQPISSSTGELGRMPDWGTIPNLGAMPNLGATPTRDAGLGSGAVPDPGAGFWTEPASGGGPDSGARPGVGADSAPMPQQPEKVLSNPLDADWPSLQPVEPGSSPYSEAPQQPSDGSAPATDNPWYLPPDD